MKVLVTGAAGRLGSCVCRQLSAAGVSFLAVDKEADSKLPFPIQAADLRDWDTCVELIQGVDVLLHFANHASWDNENPQRVFNSNVTMNANMLQAADNAECRRVIFASSIQVFSAQLPTFNRPVHEILLSYLPVDSDMPVNSRNTYALSKQVTEDLLKYYVRNRGMTCVAIRFPWLLDSNAMKSALENGGIVRGNCYDAYAYLPVYSAAEAAILAMTANLSGYNQYFVASKDNLEQRSVRELIEEQLSSIPLKKSLDSMDSLVDCSKVEAELGWKQPQSLAESVEKYGDLDAVRPYN